MFGLKVGGDREGGRERSAKESRETEKRQGSGKWGIEAFADRVFGKKRL